MRRDSENENTGSVSPPRVKEIIASAIDAKKSVHLRVWRKPKPE